MKNNISIKFILIVLWLGVLCACSKYDTAAPSPATDQGALHLCGGAQPATLPPALQRGDKVGIVFPGWAYADRDTDAPALKEWEKLMQELGLKPVLGKTAQEDAKYTKGQEVPFANGDVDHEFAREDLQAMLDDPDIKAIFMAKGGYGMNKIVDKLNLTNPKWLMGFSDCTPLLYKAYRGSIASLHASMPVIPTLQPWGATAPAPAYVQSLQAMLFGNAIQVDPQGQVTASHGGDHLLKINVESNQSNIEGTAQGPVIGGNCKLMTTNIGTATGIDYEGAIVVMEDMGEDAASVRQMVNHLFRSSKLAKAQGLIFADFSRDVSKQQEIYKEVAEFLKLKKITIPVAYGFPFGAYSANIAFPYGSKAILEVTATGSVLTFAK